MPSGEIEPAWARGMTMGCGSPPVVATVHSLGSASGTPVRVETNTTRWPSGVHPRTWSAPGCQVSRRGSPPSTGTTYTSGLPP